MEMMHMSMSTTLFITMVRASLIMIIGTTIMIPIIGIKPRMTLGDIMIMILGAIMTHGVTTITPIGITNHGTIITILGTMEETGATMEAGEIMATGATIIMDKEASTIETVVETNGIMEAIRICNHRELQHMLHAQPEADTAGIIQLIINQEKSSTQ